MNETRIRRYFEIAKEISKLSTYPRYNLGCIVVYKNKILSTGYNTVKTSPLQKKYNNFRNIEGNVVKDMNHAEISAILKIKNLDIRWEKVSIFIYREYKDGTRAVAKPCPACEKAIRDLGIKNIYYTGHDSFVHELF